MVNHGASLQKPVTSKVEGSLRHLGFGRVSLSSGTQSSDSAGKLCRGFRQWGNGDSVGRMRRHDHVSLQSVGETGNPAQARYALVRTGGICTSCGTTGSSHEHTWSKTNLVANCRELHPVVNKCLKFSCTFIAVYLSYRSTVHFFPLLHSCPHLLNVPIHSQMSPGKWGSAPALLQL